MNTSRQNRSVISGARWVATGVLALGAVGLAVWLGQKGERIPEPPAVASPSEQAQHPAFTGQEDSIPPIPMTSVAAALPEMPPATTSVPRPSPPDSPTIEAAREAMGRKAYDKAAELLTFGA